MFTEFLKQTAGQIAVHLLEAEAQHFKDFIHSRLMKINLPMIEGVQEDALKSAAETISGQVYDHLLELAQKA